MSDDGRRPTQVISVAELDAVLDRAHSEGWCELALLGPKLLYWRAPTAPETRTFRLAEPLGARISKLRTLTALTSLDLRGSHVGDDGARALASLTGLTSLDLSYSTIGVSGARALASLTSLTSLDLSGNKIGANGARALAALTSLTSLSLWDNSIAAGNVRWLAALTSLTSLSLSFNEIGDEGVRDLAELTGLTSLDLRRNGVSAEGACLLANLSRLNSLFLDYNRIGAEGARSLASLTALTSLGLRQCGIDDEGARTLANLSGLRFLALDINQIGVDGARALANLIDLPSLQLCDNRLGDEGASALANLTGLVSLDLSNNQIGDDGARALSKLTNLTGLSLGENHIGDEGARALANLTGLTQLTLDSNQVGDDGVRALSALTELTQLDLSRNRITADGARAVASLSRLTYLGLGGNKVKAAGVQTLLEAWCNDPQTEHRRYLDLGGNGGDVGRVLPREIIASNDAQAILTAYQRFRAAKLQNALRPLDEAKLIVVGNEAVGKTSLVRYVVHNQPRNPDEKKTAGTALHEKIEVETWSPHRSTVRVNVWDFGGQEIMRGTHRFFLTERSLYLIVLEDRREDDRSVYEWLEIVQQSGGDSPVIVVINKSDNDVAQRLLDETALRERYPMIAGFLRTSCNADDRSARSIAALREKIATELAESDRLKHIRDPIPEGWLRVKNAVAERARTSSVLPVRDFEGLCSGAPATQAVVCITDPKEQRALLGLLHDLGVVVAHGLRDNSATADRDVTILDPNWLTGAIYTLTNSPVVRDQGGVLRHAQLAELLEPKRYPVRWHDLIVGMMQDPALGLCLPIESESPSYLLPDALPARQPDYGVWPANSLRFRYQYTLLPAGIVPRFIVAAHGCLTEHPTMWRTGVVLGAEGCRVLVTADTALNRVEIQVAGPSARRTALSIVRAYFDDIHQRFAQLNVRAKVPLPDQPEVDVGYDHLLRLEAIDGIDHEFLPPDAERKYRVGELLEGVRDDSARARTRLVGGDPGRDRTRGAAGHRGHDDPQRDERALPISPPRVAASRFKGNIDVGIITIREDENAAVLRSFEKVATEEGRRVYRIRGLDLGGGDRYTLAVLRCVEQGNGEAQDAASAMLDDLAPRFVVVVGIAGGAPATEFTLGDVVVSTRVVDFSVEAVLKDGSREYALGGGMMHPDAAKRAADIGAMVADGDLGDWSRAISAPRPAVDLDSDGFYGEAAWQASVRKALERHFVGAARKEPTATAGAIASSDRLIKHDETLSVWLKIARQVIAVEMESAGVYRACHGRVPFLAIRGISDVVGYKRDNDWTAYACETAAAFTRAFLLTRPLVPIARGGW